MSKIVAEIPMKRRLGRPPKDPSERRTERVDVFFSVAERLKLVEDARACGLSPAAYIRKLVGGYRPSAQAEHSADPRLLLELNAIGNNLNQTIRAMKPGNPSKAAWIELKRQLQSVLQAAALEQLSAPPRLVVRLNAAGTLLNRAVADMHAGSQRRHNWLDIRQSLQEVLFEALSSHVH